MRAQKATQKAIAITPPRTYGTAKLRYGVDWALDVQPHVALRLKRVFPSIAQRAQGRLWLSATPEHCRDLEWFASRYPIAFEPEGALDTLHARAREFDAQVERAAAILDGSHYKPTAVKMALPPRQYQAQAADLCATVGGLLVADELGLGKTVTALTLLAHPDTLPAAAVVPTHLQTQWAAEAVRFLPGLRVHIAQRGNPDYLGASVREGVRSDVWPPDLLILNYHKLAGWAHALATLPVRTLIFDECQELRHSGTDKYTGAAAAGSAAHYRMGLSATPIYNYGGEFWNVLNILRPDGLGSEREFATEWCTDSLGYTDRRSVTNPKALGAALRDKVLMIRRTRADVGRELPPLTNIVHEFEPRPDVLREVETRAEELARVLLGSGKGLEKMQAAEELSAKLRLYTGLAKAPYVAEFVHMLLQETGEPVVLYGWHHAVYDLWRTHLGAYEPVWYTGKETPKQKDAAKAAFLAGKTRLMILSLRAGQGLDGLQAICHRAVFGELDWSPGVHEQCVGRVHRDGQTEPTLAYYLAATDGADPIIMDVLSVKHGQIAGVRDPEAEMVVSKSIDPDHIKRLAEHYLARSAKRGADYQ